MKTQLQPFKLSKLFNPRSSW
jgi:hypothetical protein